jgi:hypothetical protein
MRTTKALKLTSVSCSIYTWNSVIGGFLNVLFLFKFILNYTTTRVYIEKIAKYYLIFSII